MICSSLGLGICKLPRNANKEQTTLKCDNLEAEHFARDSFHSDFDPVGHGIYIKANGN